MSTSLSCLSGAGFLYENEVLAQLLLAMITNKMNIYTFLYNPDGITPAYIEAQVRNKGIQVDDAVVCQKKDGNSYLSFLQMKSAMGFTASSSEYKKCILQASSDIRQSFRKGFDRIVFVYGKTGTSNETVNHLQEFLQYARASKDITEMLPKLTNKQHREHWETLCTYLKDDGDQAAFDVAHNLYLFEYVIDRQVPFLSSGCPNWQNVWKSACCLANFMRKNGVQLDADTDLNTISMDVRAEVTDLCDWINRRSQPNSSDHREVLTAVTRLYARQEKFERQVKLIVEAGRQAKGLKVRYRTINPPGEKAVKGQKRQRIEHPVTGKVTYKVRVIRDLYPYRFLSGKQQLLVWMHDLTDYTAIGGEKSETGKRKTFAVEELEIFEEIELNETQRQAVVDCKVQFDDPAQQALVNTAKQNILA